MRITLLLALALLCSAPAEAVDCGRSLTESQINKVIKAVDTADANISQHAGSLIQEQKAMLERTAGYSEIAFGQLEKESTALMYASQSVGLLSRDLDQVLMLIQLRSVMVDQRDRAIVVRFLSLVAASVGKKSRLILKRSNELMTQISRAGIAVDMAKLRDSVSDVVAVFENCTAPEPR